MAMVETAVLPGEPEVLGQHVRYPTLRIAADLATSLPYRVTCL